MEIVTVFVVAILVSVIYFAVRLLWIVISGTFASGTSQTPEASSGSRGSSGTEMTAEDEGNVHSGPYGYSPNTAYPETQYGSDFDPEAEWNHEEQ